MTTKTPDINAINGSISDELLTDYYDITALTQNEAFLYSINYKYQLLNREMLDKDLSYSSLARALMEDDTGLNNLSMAGSNQSQEVL